MIRATLTSKLMFHHFKAFKTQRIYRSIQTSLKYVDLQELCFHLHLAHLHPNTSVASPCREPVRCATLPSMDKSCCSPHCLSFITPSPVCVQTQPLTRACHSEENSSPQTARPVAFVSAMVSWIISRLVV